MESIKVIEFLHKNFVSLMFLPAHKLTQIAVHNTLHSGVYLFCVFVQFIYSIIMLTHWFYTSLQKLNIIISQERDKMRIDKPLGINGEFDILMKFPPLDEVDSIHLEGVLLQCGNPFMSLRICIRNCLSYTSN